MGARRLLVQINSDWAPPSVLIRCCHVDAEIAGTATKRVTGPRRLIRNYPGRRSLGRSIIVQHLFGNRGLTKY